MDVAVYKLMVDIRKFPKCFSSLCDPGKRAGHSINKAGIFLPANTQV